MEEVKEVKYNLACGNDYREGYINVDDGSMLGNKFDVRDSVFNFQPLRESADEILVSHFIMYANVHKALKLFEKWFFALKKGGTLIIETQDLKKICKNILESNNPQVINDNVVQFYGAGATAGHYWTWCEETIVPLLKYVGFKKIERFEGGFKQRKDRDFTIKATK